MRTAMHAARVLKKRFTETSCKKQYESWVLEHEADEDKMFDPSKRWYPNPLKVIHNMALTSICGFIR